MWEWRVFWLIPSAVQGPDIFQLLNAKAPQFEAPRTDVYVCVTDDVGVKWRDEKKLEFKVRIQVNESIGCEQWDKIYHHKIIQPSDPDKMKKDVLDVAKKLYKDEKSDQMKKAVETIDKSIPLQSYNITKNRRKCIHKIYTIEQTELAIGAEQYRTISIESDDPRDIGRLLQTQVTYNGIRSLGQLLEEWSHIKPCGYPQFVLSLD